MREVFQSAYRSPHSTQTGLLHVFNVIIVTLDSENVCLLTLLDLSSAFAITVHDILFEGLKSNFSISGSAHSWFDSYGISRMLCVKVEELYSDQVLMPVSVPEGLFF